MISRKVELGECLEEAKKYSDPTERVACFLACLSRFLDAKFVVTGGFAVELLTGSTYRTYDVDLVPLDFKCSKELEETLRALGERLSREWVLSELPKAIDLLPVNKVPYLEIETPCGTLYVERPERLLVRYLSSWKHWESKEDQHKAIALAYALADLLDWNEVERLAKREYVERELEEVREWLSRLRSSRRGG